MIRRAALALGALTLTSCTTAEIDTWLQWWHEDPAAAEAFANRPEIQAELAAEPEEEAAEDGYDGEAGADTAGVYEPWISLAVCESGQSPPDWHIDTGNGYYGGLQFAWGSWEAVGGSGNPAHASPSEQVYRAELLLDRQGWGAWPACSSELGLR